MTYDIRIGKYKLSLLESVEIHKSVDLLADTAVIVLPGAAYNQALKIEEQLTRGDKVVIQLGYNDDLRTEFTGYLQNISTDDGSITLTCEDDIYLTRKAISDKQFTNAGLKVIADYVCQQVGGLTVNCDYDFRYDKFVISSATGFDVLRKLQEETAANIYIKENVLHIHPPYIENFGRVKYDFSRNIEQSAMQYKDAEDRKYQVEVEGILKDGTRVSVVVGTPGGDKRSVKVYGVYDKEVLKMRGESELKYIVYTGYEGDITTWLIPYVEQGYSAHIHDADYEYKDGWYYVVSVTTSFSENGASRKVELGHKISGGNG